MAVPIKKSALPKGVELATEEYSNGEMNAFFMKSGRVFKRILKD